jgi:hypothetical protein
MTVPRAGAKAIAKPVKGEPAPGSAAAQKVYGAILAGFTGLSVGVIGKWLAAEQPEGHPAKSGSNDWLNIETGFGEGSGVGSVSEKHVATMSASAAAIATYEWLKKYQPGILASQGKGEAAEIAAIENSGFAASHYGGKLGSIKGIALDTAEAKEWQTLHASKGFQESAGENVEGGLGAILPNPAEGVEGFLGKLTAFFKKELWEDVGKIALNGALVAVGLLLIIAGILTIVKPGGGGLHMPLPIPIGE